MAMRKDDGSVQGMEWKMGAGTESQKVPGRAIEMGSMTALLKDYPKVAMTVTEKATLMAMMKAESSE